MIVARVEVLENPTCPIMLKLVTCMVLFKLVLLIEEGLKPAVALPPLISLSRVVEIEKSLFIYGMRQCAGMRENERRNQQN